MPGVISKPSSLSIPHDPSELPPGADPFLITAQNGYLPTALPLRRLPAAFDALSDILDDMPILKEDGTATFERDPLIDSGALPDLTDKIDNLVVPLTGEIDMAAITAAFRDYS
jgi:indoleamine 2,3-dioxygenase